MEHGEHLVQWMTWEGGLYRLYCLGCGRYLEHITQWPNHLSPQSFWEAFGAPEGAHAYG